MRVEAKLIFMYMGAVRIFLKFSIHNKKQLARWLIT